MRRREFLAATAGCVGCSVPDPASPGYLGAHAERFPADPVAAASSWFRECELGLFLEYGVYSQLQRGPDVQFEDKIPLAEYGDLAATFDASGFDADQIADLAVRSGVGYLGLPARHADGFCLFRSIETEFSSLACTGRDLVKELAAACARRGLGMVLSYSYAADWRHPYFYPPETSWTGWLGGRPAYGTRPAEYLFGRDEDFLNYIRHAHYQLQEVAYRYGPLAGVRLEPLAGYRARPDLFPVNQTFGILREARPGLLIAFEEGATGDEDFVALRRAPADALAANSGKPVELRVELGSFPGLDAGERDWYPEIPTTLAGAGPVNLLLSTRLRPDGSLPDRDRAALLALARPPAS